jgi:hypothetical protein
LCEIITSRGGEDGGDGGESDGAWGSSLLLSSHLSDVLVEPDFKDSIAATAASSSDTSESSFFSSETIFSSETALTTLPCFSRGVDGGGVRLGDTTMAGFCAGDRGGEEDTLTMFCLDSSIDF